LFGAPSPSFQTFPIFLKILPYALWHPLLAEKCCRFAPVSGSKGFELVLRVLLVGHLDFFLDLGFLAHPVSSFAGARLQLNPCRAP